ncbi:hypothetical protein [Helicobacter sp. UBA3407]|uniref:hypothetical protein n=1 Tax=Helicobacter sp. UBA3407 TaxID=1946588 RepID=UPI002611D34F|nr:hypothetical protein [Helicobacter sp. UBA3407]
MTIKDLKNFRNAIHRDLKISPQNEKSSCFIVRENKKESPIQRIEFTFKNQDDVLIIAQKENMHTINILEEFSTNCSCDFIIFILDKKKDVRVYFCEIKPSYSKKYLEEACGQIHSSKLFLKYMMECYSSFTQNNCLKSFDIELKSQYYYIYPKINNSNKKKVYKDDLDIKNLILKPLEMDSRTARVCESSIDEFLGFE